MWRPVGLTQCSQGTALWPFIHTDTISVPLIQVGMNPERLTILLFTGVQRSSNLPGNPYGMLSSLLSRAERGPNSCRQLSCKAYPHGLTLGRLSKISFLPNYLALRSFLLGQFSTISLKGSKWEAISSWAWEWLLPVLPHSGPERWVNKRPSPFQGVR